MRWFKKAADIIIKMLIPLAILALMMSIAKIFLDLRVVFKSNTIVTGFDIMLTNILSAFIVIELLASVIEYFEIHKMRITFITDASIVFILREIMIGIYQHNLNAITIGSLSILLLVSGIVRTLAIVYSPDKTKEI